MTKITTTCQVCGRAIKANTGLIAHHGYERPGQGWQTRSCFGARFRPYEVASDALPLAIASVTRFILDTTAALANFVANPPAELPVPPRGGFNKHAEPVKVPRPEGFDPNAKRGSYMWTQKYEQTFDTRRHQMERDITGAIESRDFFKQRLADWKAPAAPEGVS
jgi:hypothetical protein